MICRDVSLLHFLNRCHVIMDISSIESFILKVFLFLGEHAKESTTAIQPPSPYTVIAESPRGPQCLLFCFITGWLFVIHWANWVVTKVSCLWSQQKFYEKDTMQKWTVHLEGGPRRVNHAAVAIGHKIFSFGGYCTGEDYDTTRPMDVHILNTVSFRWSVLPLPGRDDEQYSLTPYQRYGHTAVGHEEGCYIWGGRNDKDGACNILYCFDTSSLKWSTPQVQGEVPGARDGHSSCNIHEKMYIFGGYEENVDKFSNEVHVLDFSSFTWSLLRVRGKPARWRDFHSAVGIGTNMYIFGGRSDRAGPYHTSNEVYCSEIQVFNTASNRWDEPKTCGNIPRGRRSHSAFEYKEELYIFGGYNGVYDVHFGDMFKFNPMKNEWTLLKIQGHAPCPRRRQCCCVLGDKVFLFGGTSPCPVPMEGTEFDLMDHSDLYVLDLAPTLKTLCMLSVLEMNLDTSCLPKDVRWELTAMTTNSNISRPLNTSG